MHKSAARPCIVQRVVAASIPYDRATSEIMLNAVSAQGVAALAAGAWGEHPIAPARFRAYPTGHEPSV